MPQLKGPRKLVLNFASGTEMRDDFHVDSAVATKIKQGRPYESMAAFLIYMRKEGVTPAEIQAVQSKGPVLDGP